MRPLPPSPPGSATRSASTDSSLAITRRTDRWILWSGAGALLVLSTMRLAVQLFPRIESDDRVLAITAALEDPALADLAVSVGVTLAIALTALFQTMYVFLCAAIDERLLPGTMAATRSHVDGEGRWIGVGPAVLVGLASTLPVQILAVSLAVTAPKDSPLLAVWLTALVTIGALWARRRLRPSARGRRNTSLIVVALACVAAIALLF